MSSKLSIIILFSFFASVFSHDEDAHTIKYTTENFAEELPKKNHFVMFYAPWCGHCQRLGPTWEQLAEMLNEDDSNIKIAKVDCTADSSLCSEHDVTGYPTLKFFKVGSSEGVKFRGTRDLPTLTTFINEQLREGEEGDVEIKPPQAVSGLVELNEDNFEKYTATGKHFVKFYAPWCGHCQKLAPVWEQLAKSLEFDSSISIAKLDCTQHRTICNQFEVKGYPTLLWIEDGKKVDKYQGDRTHEDLKLYVNKMMGMAEVPAESDKPQAEEGEGVGILNGHNFKHGIESGITFVKFFAPWCGHCKRLAPTWDDLGKKFIADGGVNIVKVDCTLDINKDLCNDQEVEGFPTIYLYKNGEKISEYSGSRTLEDLYDFVKQHVGHDEL
jgi:thioredoxin domain-containing protein 5